MSELQNKLNEKFLPLEPTLTGFRLIDGGISHYELEKLENEIGAVLPVKFKEIISNFNFSELTIGPIAFCSTGDYAKELYELNTKINWWRGSERPDNLLMIANSDPYAILIDTNTGKILAFDQEQGWRNAMDIAENFEKFVRGIGTAFFLRLGEQDKELITRQIMTDTGAQERKFWEFIVK